MQDVKTVIAVNRNVIHNLLVFTDEQNIQIREMN